MFLKKCFFALMLLVFSQLTIADSFSPDSTYDVCFTIYENCTNKVVDAISQAKKQILVQAYSFTSAPIAKELVNAKRRGVEVRVILDKSQVKARYSSAVYLENNGIDPLIDFEPAIAHNKVMVIDNETVITGSFNFTKAAEEKNAENLLIIHDAKLAKKYEKNWYRREKESSSVSEYKSKTRNKYYDGDSWGRGY
jgi:phosphatidylserine/phosphatidylglycerophosphate/cardiolipin synthase-like enzyme